MEKLKQILMISAPYDDTSKLEALREQICVWLHQGVVVLPEGSEFSVIKVTVAAQEELELSPEYYQAVDELFEDKPQQETTETEKDMNVALHGGRCSEEKRAIQLKLQAFRSEHGLGCWRKVAEASGGAVTPEMLRDMASGTGIFGVAEWRKAETALLASTISCEPGAGGGNG